MDAQSGRHHTMPALFPAYLMIARISRTMDKNQMKRWAHGVLERAILKGKFPRLTEVMIPCVDCGERATDYDHRDYRQPLMVVPTCRSCNLLRGAGISGSLHLETPPPLSCPHCKATWIPRHPNPKVCPRCGYRLIKERV